MSITIIHGSEIAVIRGVIMSLQYYSIHILEEACSLAVAAVCVSHFDREECAAWESARGRRAEQNIISSWRANDTDLTRVDPVI